MKWLKTFKLKPGGSLQIINDIQGNTKPKKIATFQTPDSDGKALKQALENLGADDYVLLTIIRRFEKVRKNQNE